MMALALALQITDLLRELDRDSYQDRQKASEEIFQRLGNKRTRALTVQQLKYFSKAQSIDLDVRARLRYIYHCYTIEGQLELYDSSENHHVKQEVRDNIKRVLEIKLKQGRFESEKILYMLESRYEYLDEITYEYPLTLDLVLKKNNAEPTRQDLTDLINK